MNNKNNNLKDSENFHHSSCTIAKLMTSFFVLISISYLFYTLRFITHSYDCPQKKPYPLPTITHFSNNTAPSPSQHTNKTTPFKEKTNISHIVFGIWASSRLWNHTKISIIHSWEKLFRFSLLHLFLSFLQISPPVLTLVHENPRAFFNRSNSILLEPLAHGSVNEETQREKLPNPFQAALASALTFSVGALVPLIAAVFIRNHKIRMGVVAAAVSLALLVFGGVGAVLGKTPVTRSCRRVLVGVFQALATFDHDKTQQEALRRFQILLDGINTSLPPANIRRVAYVAVMRNTTTKNRTGLESLLSFYRSSIASSADPNVVIEVLNLLLSDAIPDQDIIYVLAGISNEGSETAWRWLKDNWERILARYGARLLLTNFIS
ncbi:Aminopeptidase M1 [Glycine soja]